MKIINEKIELMNLLLIFIQQEQHLKKLQNILCQQIRLKNILKNHKIIENLRKRVIKYIYDKIHGTFVDKDDKYKEMIDNLFINGIMDEKKYNSVINNREKIVMNLKDRNQLFGSFFKKYAIIYK